MTRLCKECKQEKDVLEFPKNHLVYKNPVCKGCRNAYQRSRRKAQPELYKAHSVKYRKTEKAKVVNEAYRKLNVGKLRDQARELKRKYRKDPVKKAVELVQKRQYNEKNREKNLAYAQKRQAERQEFLNKIKDVPCKDCGETFPPYCMDFDHTQGVKEGNISEMKSYSIEKILAEVAKCDIVCSNCHRIRTFNRNNQLSGASN